MRTITLSAHDGEVLTGHLPESWAEVPLAPYCHLAEAFRQEPRNLPARIEAVAGLVGLPAEPLLNQVSHYGAILNAAPWLFSSLPPSGEPVTEFKHLGVRYVSRGHLRKLTAGDLEALYTFQEAYSAQPLLAAPSLLAILYAPAGKTQTPELVHATAQAFASLPLSIAWPCVVDFMRSGAASASLHIRTYSALSTQLSQALTSLETSLQTSSAFTRCWRKPLRFLFAWWIKSVRATALTV